MATNLKIELDIADDEGHEAACAWARDVAERHGVRAELAEENGPGGGWPIWRFEGPEPALRALYAEYCGGAAIDEFELNVIE